MMYRMNYSDLYNRLVQNNATALQEIYKNKTLFQQDAIEFLTEYKHGRITQNDIAPFDAMMRISNIIYNNFDAMTPIEDGIYDQLMVAYKALLPNSYQVGATPVSIDYTGNIGEEKEDMDGYRYPFQTVEGTEDWIFGDELLKVPPLDIPSLMKPVDRTKYQRNEKKSLVIPHMYPKLVGTLDKCKFTLISEASAVGADMEDPTIKIFERDFLGAHIQQGIIDPNNIELLLELKMDGMSVEADVTNEVLSARSRGDTNLDMAEDLTTVLRGYKFPHCPEIDQPFGMKFEAIITKTNLERLGTLKGKIYKNSRNGIVGLMRSVDAAAFQDLITLVPLETSLDVDPITEVNFMNQYYTKDVYLPYAYVSGNYTNVLYQVYKFVKEAEAMRPIANFLYDGIVVHYTNPEVRAILGRKNSVNQYSMAIKFNPMVKQTVFRGYTFSVGQNGVIVPIGHYDPVEFLGTIHTKSSCHSFSRFNELHLAVGDVVEVAYVNDVMPYLNRPYEDFVGEYEEKGLPIPFPQNCTCCGAPIRISEDRNSAFCTNFFCPERVLARLVNMLDKLSIKGFAESSIQKLGIRSLTDFLQLTEKDIITALGEGNGKNLIEERARFLSVPIQDYRLIGSLGFTNVAAETWKKILAQVSINEILTSKDLAYRLTSIRGIGSSIASTIADEVKFFYTDIMTIQRMPNVIYTYGKKEITVRWTGCRDSALESLLCSQGIDANSRNSVTKKTNILVVPYTGYMSDKVKKKGEQTLVVPLEEFKGNFNYYLSLVAQPTLL